MINHMLSLVAIAALLATSCGTSNDDTAEMDSSSTIDTNDFTPTALAVSLPTSLTNSSGSSGLRLQESEPGTSNSQGYWELTDKVMRVQWQLAELTLNNAILDNVISTSCGGSIDAACTAENACATITAQIINNLKQSLGEEQFEDEYSPLSYIEDMVGQEHCLPNVTIGPIANSTDGYSYQATVSFDENNKIVQSWNAEKTKVKIVHSYIDSFGDDAGAATDGTMGLFKLQDSDSSYFSGNSTFIFDSSTNTFKARNDFSYSYNGNVDQGEEKFTIQGLENKADLNGIVLKGTFSSEFNGNKWSLGIEANVDNEGGFIRTQSGWTQYTVSEMTLSGACTEGIEYSLYPSGTDVTTLSEDSIWMDQIGAFSCWMAATSLDASSVYIWNQLPSDPTGLVIATSTWPDWTEEDYGNGEAYFPTVAASNLSIVSLSAAPETSYYCYEEEFSSAGQVTAWRSAEGQCDQANLSWVGGNGDFGGAYTYDESAEGDLFQEIKATITGVAESSVQTASGFSDFLPAIYITSSGADLASAEMWTDEFYEKVIGMAWPKAPDAAASTTDMNNYQVDFWGSEDQVSTAEIYVESFDPDTGNMSVTRISGASLTATE